MGLKCSSVLECLISLSKTLGSIPSITKKGGRDAEVLLTFLNSFPEKEVGDMINSEIKTLSFLLKLLLRT
jgi:hypothetical protein